MQQNREFAEQILRTKPLVHCITNYVTVNDCANALLAIGARPVMSHAAEEAMEITAGSRALVLNLGATEYYDAMEKSALQAGLSGIPVILDPVGVSGSTFRRNFAGKLIGKGLISVIRGNVSELRALAEDRKTAVGVDAGTAEAPESDETIDRLITFSGKTHCIVVQSGAVDLVTDGNTLLRAERGSVWMQRITGSGCMSSSVLGAYAAAARDMGKQLLEAAYAGMNYVGAAGEAAEAAVRKEGAGTGTYRVRFIDALSLPERLSL